MWIRRKPHGQAGFTLAELLVSVVVLAQILVAALVLFDTNGKLARVQTQVAEMQQGLRISQYQVVRDARMAGRGPLPVGGLPNGIAVDIEDAVASGTLIANLTSGSPTVVEDTDILKIRGVIGSPIYQIDNSDGSGAFAISGSTATLQILVNTQHGIQQDVEPLRKAITDNVPEAILLVAALTNEVYMVAELTGGIPGAPNSGDPVTLNLLLSGGPRSAEYLALSAGGVVPPTLNRIGWAGIVDEYRYYVREEWATPGDNTTELMPRLTRAKLFPGTEIGWGADGATQLKSLKGDIAENVIDFQVAIGLDTDTSDLTTTLQWFLATPGGASPPMVGDLMYLRVNTLVRTQGRDFQYQADDLTNIENHAYDSSSSENARENKMYRRRQLQTVVSLRNVT